MTQQTLNVDPIVWRPETGERFVATSPGDWRARLDAWRQARRASEVRLQPIARRAAKRGCWTLYRRAVRAARLREPACPMPADHCMFENPAAYDCVTEGSQAAR